MLIFIVFSLLRWTDNPTYHILVGTITTLLFIVHVYLNRKILVAMIKSNKEKKLNKKNVYKCRMSLFLIVIWSIAIGSGLLAIGSYVYMIDSMSIFSKIHAVSSRLGVIFIVIHCIQHLTQIKSYIKIKK